MAKRFERQLDKATDSTLIDPNWDAIIECVDLIRGGEVPVKAAVAAIRKRYHNENPHVAHHALLVLEACMKNCGAKFHAEIATKDFMEDLKNLSLDTTPDKVKNKILELLQCWAMAFKNKPEYKIVVDTHNLMKLAGFDFPHVAEADAMFIAESAPDWADGEECFRCRTAFGLITRKHHCRACGQIFCDKCSSKQSFLPQYGIEKQVRVCDGCYEKTAAKKTDTGSSSSSAQPSSKTEKPLPTDAKKTAEQRAVELKQAEEDEINLAIALSQSEAEAQERERQRRLYQLYNGTDITNGVKTNGSTNGDELNKSVYKGAAPSNGTDGSVSTGVAHIDPELARYLNRDYWQQRKNEQRNTATTAMAVSGDDHRKTPTPTAPPPSESSRCAPNPERDATVSVGAPSLASTTKQLEGDVTPAAQFVSAEEEETAETMEFCRQLKEQVTVMDNRIRSNVARNRSVVNDTAIQSLFIRLTEMHAQVMARMNKLEDQRSHFESLQDSLAHIQEARQAVDALREDHERQRQARMMEEQRLKQIQMQQKVDLMRQKKHEMILHQRQMALLRFQQQEQEMQRKRMQMMGLGGQVNPAAQAAEMPYNQTAAKLDQPNVQATVPYGYPPSAFVDQAQLVYGMSVTLPTQSYLAGAQDGATASTVVQDPNTVSYVPVQSYGSDQVPLSANVQQFKPEAASSNYQVNVAQNSLQPASSTTAVAQNPVQLPVSITKTGAQNPLQLSASNTPSYSTAAVHSAVPHAYVGYPQRVEQRAALPGGQQFQSDTNIAEQKLGIQDPQPTSIGNNTPPTMVAANIARHGGPMMHSFSPYPPSSGMVMQLPSQSSHCVVQPQANSEQQPQAVVSPAEELLISFD